MFEDEGVGLVTAALTKNGLSGVEAGDYDEFVAEDPAPELKHLSPYGAMAYSRMCHC